LTALEVGCGNGHNCFELARAFPGLRITGVDYAEQMIAGARAAATAAEPALSDRVRFTVGDLLALDAVPDLSSHYQLIFTVRCLINLSSLDAQQRAIGSLASRLAPGGYLLLLENSRQTHARQNEARVALGLPPRAPAPFNVFLDDDALLPWLRTVLDVVAVDDFASLHDLVLYALVPAAWGGEVDYGHPMVAAATELCLHASQRWPGAFGAFGQNRLYVCRDRGAPDSG
jgi:SAM-dependent methyltransferase